jgi:CDP-diglyceride synthetase
VGKRKVKKRKLLGQLSKKKDVVFAIMVVAFSKKQDPYRARKTI